MGADDVRLAIAKSATYHNSVSHHSRKMKTEELILLSKIELTNRFPNVTLGSSSFRGPHWHLNFEVNDLKMNIAGDIGFQIKINSKDYELPLWKLNEEIEQLGKTTEPNIKRQIGILAIEIENSKNKLINKFNGQINLDKKHIIKPNLIINEEIIRKWKPEERDLKNGYVWLKFENIKYNNQRVILNICSNKNKVVLINMYPLQNEQIVNESWNEWNKSKELEKLTYYEEWITKEIGRNKYYPWGTIEAVQDNKSATTSIIVNYKMNNGD